MESNYLIIIIIFLSLYYYYFLLKIYRGLTKLELQQNQNDVKEFISIIIPFRNESDNIISSLKSIEAQNYPKDKYEVIYVNDHSDDDSREKLCSAGKGKNIKIISVKNTDISRAYKKRAVTYGIENSSGDIIVTTDADCIHPETWLRTLISFFDKETAMVSGPVEFFDSTEFLNKIQRLEFQGLILAGAGLMSINEPVICSAANLAYRKNVFYEVKGFADQVHLTSGDDELLMQKIHRTGKYKVKFCADQDALVRTQLNKSVEQFYNQRKRWASKGLFYGDISLITKLILIFFFYLSLPLMLFLAFFSQIYLLLFLISYTGKCTIEYLIMKKGNDLIFKSNVLKYFFVAELLQVTYIIIAGVSGVFGNLKWKGRNVKR